MLAYPIATAAILLMGQQGSSHAASASTAPKKKSPPNKIDFLRAMNRHSKRRTLSKETEADFKRELYGSTKHSAALRKKLMKRSVVTKTPGSSSSTVESSTTASTMARTTNQGSEVMKKHDVDGLVGWLARTQHELSASHCHTSIVLSLALALALAA